MGSPRRPPYVAVIIHGYGALESMVACVMAGQPPGRENRYLDPAPAFRRKQGMSWETFLKAHWGEIAATEFFSVEVLTRAFEEVLESSSVKTVKLPARNRNLNAYAERFVRSINSECLAQIIPLGESHLRKAVKESTEHYHIEHNHQGLGNELFQKSSGEPNLYDAVECQERLEGILKYYYRRAA
jgi:hypothetical protein